MSQQADETTRYETLCRLEAILRTLVDRHGARITLGEMLAVTAARVKLMKQERVTIAEIAEATGLPKQNISRWAHKRVGDSIVLRVNEEDRREHEVTVIDQYRGGKTVDRIAEIMGIEGTPRSPG